MSIRSYKGYRRDPGELQAGRIDKAAPHNTHSPGWPHLSKTGNCLCLGSCCMGRDGCRCPECGHQSHPRLELAGVGG